MKLKSLTILNFKGISSLELDLDGKSAAILGDNATGKTSVYDAFTFLLFGKDSRGVTNFSIKPIVNGEPLHNVETYVAAGIETDDGSVINLIRRYREVWTRRRGDVEDTFTGHETAFYVDGLPVSQAAYKKAVESIIPEGLFRILTNPFQLPEAMKWQERRTVLFEIFGELSDADIAARDPRFQQLLAKAGRYTVEQYMTGLKTQIRGYNQELKELPARMDEAARTIIEDDDPEAARAAADQIALEANALRESLRGEDRELTVQMATVQRETLELRDRNAAYRMKTRAENAEQNRKAMNALAEQLEALHIPELEATAAIETKAAGALEQEVFQLRAKFTAEASRVFEPKDVCPACGRPFTDGEMEAARKAFDASVKARLDDINAEGRELTARLKAAKERASEALTELDRKKRIAAEYEEALAELRSAELAEDMEGYAEQLEALTERRADLMRAINAAATEAREKNQAISDKLAERMEALATARQHEAACIASRTARARIEELRDQQTAVVRSLEDSEAQVALCEEFIRTRVAAVEDSINRHFKLVRWQLYRDQINGGLDEICEATVDGIPFHDLNGAMRINAGLDIINACIDKTGKSAPVFVDNAESVTKLFEPDAQVIRLVVSEKDKQLRLQK